MTPQPDHHQGAAEFTVVGVGGRCAASCVNGRGCGLALGHGRTWMMKWNGVEFRAGVSHDAGDHFVASAASPRPGADPRHPTDVAP